ncbi:MAG: hypothetical protein VR69_05020 [Peptococcaceae bacterium BRH_c4b]|nr:MAG: hypothetical protein VR69_05020 [Peptococcaceae bacterium BRH_c4b]
MKLISIHSIAVTFSKVIARELNFDNVKRAKISYGLEATIGAIIKIVLFPVVFFLFGVLKQSLIALLTIAILRYASGGTHCKTFIRCLFVSTALLVSIGMFAKALVINNYLYYVLNIVCFIIIVLRSPVDPPEKPIKTKQKRYIMKLLSTLILILLIYISSITIEIDVKNSIILAMYLQVLTLTLTGWDKTFFNFIDQLKLKTKEVNIE